MYVPGAGTVPGGVHGVPSGAILSLRAVTWVLSLSRRAASLASI